MTWHQIVLHLGGGDWIESADDVINAIHDVFKGMNPIILSRVSAFMIGYYGYG